MKHFTINENDAGRRLDRWLERAAPLLPPSLAQKYLRLKRIRVNGLHVKPDYRLKSADELDVYISDEFFDAPNEDNAYLAINSPKVDILYEDNHILLALKPPGQLSHAAGGEYVKTLITNIQALLFQRGDWKPALSGTFRPALVNRIDRNTGGIVIAAKSAAALHILSEKIRSREIDKYYLAELIGVPDPPNGKLEGYVFKDAKQNRVYVSEHSSPGSKLAVTEYKTLKVKGGFSLVECRLLTGRTHQIRAQFAAAGLPLSGDGKYGVAPARGGGQALYSYKLTFAFTSPAGELEYLNGKTFIAPLGGTGLPLAAELQITDFEA